jgi:hypothetical protein
MQEFVNAVVGLATFIGLIALIVIGLPLLIMWLGGDIWWLGGIFVVGFVARLVWRPKD